MPASDARALASRLRVRIERSSREPASYTGQLAALASAGAQREVRGQSCAEVLEALALIAVLVAAEEPPPGASPAQLAPSGWALTRAEELALAEEAATSAAAPPPGAHLRWGPAAFTWLGSSSLPRPALQYGLGIHAEWTGSAWQPSLRLAAYTSGTQEVRAGGGAARARFQHVALSGAACPLHFPLAPALRLRPCLTFDVGRLSGEGVAVPGARRRSWPWLSAAPELQLGWAPLEDVQLDLLLAVVVPLTRPRFYFLPELTSFEVPRLGLRAGAGLSWFF